MHRRCVDTKHPSFKYYGGKGVYVSLRWSGKDGYANFVADMGEPPSGMTLALADGAVCYEKEACQWVAPGKNTKLRENAGAPRRPRSLMSRARAAGIPYMVVYLRINTLHWPVEKALNTPVNPRGSKSIMQKAMEAQRAASAGDRGALVESPAELVPA